MRINYQSDVIFTTFIRVFGLVLKFIMMLSMGKYALESEVGRFAIIVTLVAYSSQVLGLEFHYYSIRQIQKGKFDQLVMIRDQVVFHIATYILLLPVLYLVLYKFIGVVFIGILMAIIFFEQISQEMFRVVSALQHPVKATILLFIRTAPWMIFTVYVLYGESDKGFLVEIMPYWLLSAFTSVILSIYFLKKD